MFSGLIKEISKDKILLKTTLIQGLDITHSRCMEGVKAKLAPILYSKSKPLIDVYEIQDKIKSGEVGNIGHAVRENFILAGLDGFGDLEPVRFGIVFFLGFQFIDPFNQCLRAAGVKGAAGL